MKFTGIVLAILVYCFLALAFCGDLLMPVMLVKAYAGRLGLWFWWPIFAACGVAAWRYSGVLARKWQVEIFRLPTFVATWMISSVVLVGAYAEWVRSDRIAAFKADRVVSHFFIRSLREAPREFQFFLHAAALKDCKPYAWSYRLMDFVPLEPNVAVNVIPDAWVKECGIKRTR